MSSFATAVGVGFLGVLAGVPARAVIQRLAGPLAAAQAGRRWPGIAPAMGLLWFAVTLCLAGQGLGWAVPAYLALAFVCLVLAVIDAATGLLPNRITSPAFPVVAGLLLAASLGLGELGRLGRGLLAAASVGGLFLLLALLSPHGMGVGDVKLAPTLGLALGWLSWGTVAVGWWPPSCSPAWRGWRAWLRWACRARRGCRSAPGWSSVRCWACPRRRRGRRLVPGLRARRQVGRVSSCGR
jgi:leader peptidase (prepilin peptidase) / N-methyltransferase